MKKVLIIGYFWPYRSGSGRMLGLAKYLPEFGWEPVILTAPLERPVDPKIKARVIETFYRGDVFSFWRKLFNATGISRSVSGITEELKSKVGIRGDKTIIERLRTLYLELFAYPDPEKKWRKPALAAARAFLDREKADALLSVWPVTSHLVANELKRDYRIPWAADFPDPWSENHAYPYGRVRRWLDRRLERQTLQTADALTAATPEYAAKEEQVTGRACRSILHGFDPELLNNPPVSLTKKFTISYTGTIYRGNQNPLTLLDALAELHREKSISPSDFEVSFVGENQDWLNAEARERGLQEIVRIEKPVSRLEAVARQRKSQILLLLGWESQEDQGVIPLKLYEYLAARRPILMTGGTTGEYVARILEDTRAGVHAVTKEQIRSSLLSFYREYKKSGSVELEAPLESVNKFSYRTTAKQFGEMLNTITTKQ